MSQPRFAISSDRTFHVLSTRHMICKSIPSSMNEYNCTAIKYAQLLRITRHETSQKPSVAYQYTALLFQITICCLWRQKTPLIKAVFHPASYTCTVDCSLSGVLAKLKIRRLRMKITQSRDFTFVLRNLKIGCACNLEIGMQSQDSENV